MAVAIGVSEKMTVQEIEDGVGGLMGGAGAEDQEAGSAVSGSDAAGRGGEEDLLKFLESYATGLEGELGGPDEEIR